MARRLGILAGAFLLLISASAFAAPRKLEILNLEGAPFRLARVAPAEAAPDGFSDGLRVAFSIQNTTAAHLERVVVEVVVESPSGEAKGFHGFTIPATLAPGVSYYQLYVTGRYQVSPGDRLVLVPVSARVAGRPWRVDPETDNRLHRSLGETRGDLSALDRVWAAESTPPEPGIENPRPGCSTDCSLARRECASTCNCGVSSFSCTCSKESISHTCNCFQCPPSPGSGN